MSAGGINFHWYGNWGGPGHGGGEPVDNLDRAYKLHDKMYGVLGDYNPTADTVHALIAPLIVGLDPSLSWQARAKGLASSALFGASAATVGPLAWAAFNAPKALDAVEDLSVGFDRAARTAAGWATDLGKGLVDGVGDAGQGLASAAGTVGATALDTVENVAEGAVETAKNVGSSVAGFLKSFW